MNKKLLIPAVICLLLFCIFFMLKKEPNGKKDGKLSVAVTFDAMKELTLAVAGGRANISVLIPEGMEPHDFEPKPKDLAFLSEAEVLVYNGLGMEFWLEAALKAVNNKKLIKAEASKGIMPVELAEHEEHEEHEEEHHCGHKHHHHHHHHHHGTADPHAWLSLSSAKIMVNNIAEALSKADPENAGEYRNNADSYIQKLTALFSEYENKFKSLKNKKMVVSHAAFGYLCRDFNLVQNAVTDVFADGEPGPKEMAKLIDYCKEHNIKVIFSEELVSPELAQTLANEIKAKVVKIYTMESPEDNLSYFDRMKENLSRIYENLK